METREFRPDPTYTLWCETSPRMRFNRPKSEGNNRFSGKFDLGNTYSTWGIPKLNPFGRRASLKKCTDERPGGLQKDYCSHQEANNHGFDDDSGCQIVVYGPTLNWASKGCNYIHPGKSSQSLKEFKRNSFMELLIVNPYYKSMPFLRNEFKKIVDLNFHGLNSHCFPTTETTEDGKISPFCRGWNIPILRIPFLKVGWPATQYTELIDPSTCKSLPFNPPFDLPCWSLRFYHDLPCICIVSFLQYGYTPEI